MDDTWTKIHESIFLEGIPVTRNEPMKHHTTIRIGGPVQLLVKPFDIESLRKTVEILKRYGVVYKILGRGSNLLVSDKKLDMAVISTEYLDDIEIKGEYLKLGAGTTLAKAIYVAARLGLSGIEFAAGIPGSVGGAVIMNAGAFDGCMADVVERVEILDEHGKVRVLSKKELGFGYRTSSLRGGKAIVLSVEVKLSSDDPLHVKRKIRRYLEHRFRTQPLEYPSAGSVFKRPMEDFYVGKAIENLGLKGLKIGGAMISTKHAGFIVNIDNATFQDVMALMELVQKKVEEHFHVKLEREVELWNV